MKASLFRVSQVCMEAAQYNLRKHMQMDQTHVGKENVFINLANSCATLQHKKIQKCAGNSKMKSRTETEFPEDTGR